MVSKENESSKSPGQARQEPDIAHLVESALEGIESFQKLGEEDMQLVKQTMTDFAGRATKSQQLYRLSMTDLIEQLDPPDENGLTSFERTYEQIREKYPNIHPTVLRRAFKIGGKNIIKMLAHKTEDWLDFYRQKDRIRNLRQEITPGKESHPRGH